MEAQEGVVADPLVAGEDVELSGGDRLLDRGLQQLEDPEPGRVVTLVPRMQEVPDVAEDEAVDVGLVLEMPFEALQAVDEDERIAVGHQLSQGALGAGGARALERFGAPALPAVDPQIAGRALPQPALLHLMDQRRPQAVPGVVDEVRVWSCCPP